MFWGDLRPETYHHARGHRNPPATVGVRNDVSVADTEEGDGYQPHGVQQVGVFLVVVPGQQRDNQWNQQPQQRWQIGKVDFHLEM